MKDAMLWKKGCVCDSESSSPFRTSTRPLFLLFTSFFFSFFFLSPLFPSYLLFLLPSSCSCSCSSPLPSLFFPPLLPLSFLPLRLSDPSPAPGTPLPRTFYPPLLSTNLTPFFLPSQKYLFSSPSDIQLPPLFLFIYRTLLSLDLPRLDSTRPLSLPPHPSFSFSLPSPPPLHSHFSFPSKFPNSSLLSHIS